METPKPTQNLIETRIKLSVPQRFDTGPMMGHFLKALKDDKKILATKCPLCSRTLLPPRGVCSVCSVEASEWIELADEGELLVYDVVYVPTLNPLTGEMRKVPYTTCWVLLDGGDATLWHFLDETDPAKLRPGLRVKAVWSEERTGRILDISHFAIVK